MNEMTKETGREEEGQWRVDAAYSQTTRFLTVTVQPTFLEEQSLPSESQFVWAYRVSIENNGSQTVRLLRRHWRITDALGRVHEVKGPGVVGEQPVLRPGERFEYTSGTPLNTPSGIMAGSYQMENDVGEHFDIVIPTFSLDSPHQARRLN
jgi:ApaG protein